jgi:hypothetical protein
VTAIGEMILGDSFLKSCEKISAEFDIYSAKETSVVTIDSVSVLKK